MPCTTVLVGKKASYDGSTMIARTDDGFFDVKKTVVVEPKDQPRTYKSVIGHLEIELPDNPMRYTACPSVDKSHGIWAATGINECNVGITATETITSNPRVLGADPLVRYQKAKNEGEEDIPGGIGEEDIVVLVLPYVKTAKEGAIRLGELLERYGTYECNGIAINDANDIWWVETIGGHHWIAKRVKDEECVVMANQFGLDNFDFDDAFGKQESNMCSADLREFMRDNFLDLTNIEGNGFNPRNAFGSSSDNDHAYNTPRTWFMGRYVAPYKYSWDGENAQFKPESNNIPWGIVPDKKLTVEDVKYMLSSHYQGTPYDPYSSRAEKHGAYRPIGMNRTGVMSICQIRGYKPQEIQAIEWICYGSTSFDAVVPMYTNASKIPAYLSEVETDISTDNFYWGSVLVDLITDAHFASCVMQAERYQEMIACRSHEILNEYDKKMTDAGDYTLIEEANEKIAAMAKEETIGCLNKLVKSAGQHMKNAYNRTDFAL